MSVTFLSITFLVSYLTNQAISSHDIISDNRIHVSMKNYELMPNGYPNPFSKSYAEALARSAINTDPALSDKYQEIAFRHAWGEFCMLPTADRDFIVFSTSARLAAEQSELLDALIAECGVRIYARKQDSFVEISIFVSHSDANIAPSKAHYAFPDFEVFIQSVTSDRLETAKPHE